MPITASKRGTKQLGTWRREGIEQDVITVAFDVGKEDNPSLSDFSRTDVVFCFGALEEEGEDPGGALPARAGPLALPAAPTGVHLCRDGPSSLLSPSHCCGVRVSRGIPHLSTSLLTTAGPLLCVFFSLGV